MNSPERPETDEKHLHNERERTSELRGTFSFMQHVLRATHPLVHQCRVGKGLLSNEIAIRSYEAEAR